MEAMWNLWHGCRKKSDGCLNCYVYRSDAKYGRDSSIIEKNKNFALPLRKKRDGTYFYPADTMFWTCFTSDFLIEECDGWRVEAWKIIKERADCQFFFITKRIDRFMECIPPDWGDGYDNVHVGCTAENQKLVDYRLSIFKKLPIKFKTIINEPLLEEIDLSNYLDDTIYQVVAGGESGDNTRPCDYAWILKIHDQCVKADVKFWFKQTGAFFIKDGKTYKVPRNLQHVQARKAGKNYK